MIPDDRTWGVHPKPKDDELLSSWTDRTARAHGLPLYRFMNLVWGSRDASAQDFDLRGGRPFVERMAERTSTSLERARATTLSALEDWLFNSPGPAYASQLPWILPMSLTRRGGRLAGLQFCPACLGDDTPYFRRRWRLALASTCLEHGLVLLNRCPKCGAPAVPRRARDPARCHQCDFDLRGAASQPATIDALAIEAAMWTAVNRGWAQLGHFGTLRSNLYFSLVHAVARLLIARHRGARLREVAAKLKGGRGDPPPIAFAPGDLHRLEWLSPEHRHGLMPLIGRLLDGWPYQFVSAASDAGLTATMVLRDVSSPVYAFLEPVRAMLPVRAATFDDQVEAAERVLVRRGEWPSAARVSALAGLRPSKVNRARVRGGGPVAAKLPDNERSRIWAERSGRQWRTRRGVRPERVD